MSTIMRNSVIECQNSICREKVWLYSNFVGSLSTFRCGACLPHTTFREQSPNVGNYTRCDSCRAQFKYRGGQKLCHVC